VLLAAYAFYWHVAANALSARLDRANGHEIVPGVVFAFAENPSTDSRSGSMWCFPA